jgi:hypothetical protein
MIKKFIKRLLGKAEAAPVAPVPVLGQRVELGAEAHGIDAALVDANAERVVRTLKEPAGGAQAEGLRCRHRCDAGAGQGPVPPRVHHRPALSHRACGLWPRART